ncbi:hypothetical protein K502DRAFT_121341 [Neoconidiobolus thromboides FSU 785]|nr:hypothetical protein K502DRAFT_121341 [Neoconidiobolus thromboides FSU 785]
MKKVESMAHLANEYHQLKKKVDLKKHEIELLDQRLANSSYNQVQIELEANEKNLIEAEGQIGKCEAKVKELDDHLLSLEKEMSDFKDNKSLKLEELESKIKQLKKGIAAKKTTFKSIQFEL